MRVIAEKMNLWDTVPGVCMEVPTLTAYIPENKKSDAAVIILPGGGYLGRTGYEGEGYAEFLNRNGITAFVCDYRIYPHEFPLPLLDIRRAIRTVRFYADKYGINKSKIAIMGSSAGGYLSAVASTYFKPIEFEDMDDIDREEFIPNAQILCYPYINATTEALGKSINEAMDVMSKVDIENSVSGKTPACFVWHVFDDVYVPMENSMDYVKALKKYDVPVEMHIFPEGGHGLGLADGKMNAASNEHVSVWGEFLIKWLRYIGF